MMKSSSHRKTPKDSTARSGAGFTLVEILVVAVIFVVVVVGAVYILVRSQSFVKEELNKESGVLNQAPVQDGSLMPPAGGGGEPEI